MKLEIKQAACGYGKLRVLENISLTLEDGEILCLLGPNGVGKTTLFKTILGFLRLFEGKILLNGEDIQSWSRRRLAQAIGYVPQAHTPPFPFQVLDVVMMGRTAHLGLGASPGKNDRVLACEALESLNVFHLRDKIYTEISGGERQLVLIARALAQQPQILVMDEPTSNLDFGNQVRVLEQIKRLSQRGLSIIMTSHVPDHAFLVSTKVALIQRNNAFSLGSAEEVVTEENLKSAYGINVKIIATSAQGGEPVKACIPLLN